MQLVGLTGGIGAGKSTVADLLVGRGAVLVDADVIAREIVEPGQPALASLVERFGAAILRPDGSLHRQALADLAFASDEGKQALNDITWPAIREEMQRRVDAAPDDAVVVVDAALLLESAFGLEGGYEQVVVVEAPARRAARPPRGTRASAVTMPPGASRPRCPTTSGASTPRSSSTTRGRSTTSSRRSTRCGSC